MPGGAATFRTQENAQLKKDVDNYNDSFAKRADDTSGTIHLASGATKTIHVADLLTSWHLQMVVEPMHEQEESPFDPLDENKVDLTGLPNVPQKGQ